MEQTELNGVVHKWLEELSLQPQPPDANTELPLIGEEGTQSLLTVLERLRKGFKLTSFPKASLHAGGTHLAVLGRQLASYLNVALEPKDLDPLAGALHTHTANCLKQLLGLDKRKGSLASHFHVDSRDGLVRVIRMALFMKYEKLATEGLLAVAAKPPVIYIGARGEVGMLHHACSLAGLPLSCVSVVSCSQVHGASHAMDISALVKCVSSDLNQGKTPLLVIAYAGTPLAGHMEDMTALREFCNQHNMWLHVLGHGLSSLFFQAEREEMDGILSADSFTLYPGVWFGLLSCPYVTLHKSPIVVHTEGLPTASNFPGERPEGEEGGFFIPQMIWLSMFPSGVTKLLPLSLWLCFQYLGSAALVDTVGYCRNLIRQMIVRLDEIPGIKRLLIPSHLPLVVIFKYTGCGQLVIPASLRKLVRPESPASSSTFQKAAVESSADSAGDQESQKSDPSGGGVAEIKAEPSTSAESHQGPNESSGGDHGQTEDEETPFIITIHGIPQSTTNMYNMMISRDLQQHLPKVGVATYDMGSKDGVAFRFDPINGFPEHSTSIEDVENFAELLWQKVDSIHTTVLARSLFEVALKKSGNLRWMEFPHLHCVAVVQYVPRGWVSKSELTLDEVNSLNKANMELCQRLSNISPVFTVFQHGNFVCIVIKEVPSNFSIYELLEKTVVETNCFEEDKNTLQAMATKIQEGIEKAKLELVKEKEKKEQEESYLRYIPVVGSVLNWWSPTSPTMGEGRSFNLASGKVEATTAIYKNRMQLAKPTTDTEPKMDQLQQDQEGDPPNDSASASSTTGDHGDPTTTLDTPTEAPPTEAPPTEAPPPKEERDDQANQHQELPAPSSLETKPVTPEQ